MFGQPPKGAKSEGETSDQQDTAQEFTVRESMLPLTGPARVPALARRVVEMPGSSRRPSSSSLGEDRKLIVGKGLSVAGEITSCDILVVEGKVEAKLSDGKMLEIAEAGQFRGSVEIENADIAGRFDGQLVVHGRLTLRSTGRISGMVKYGELEVNAGGQIIGEMQVMGGGAQAATPGYKNTSRHADDDQRPESKSERRSA